MNRLLLVSVLVAGCGPVDTSPTAVFDDLWTEFDLRYGLFGVKDYDWDDAYDAHRPRVTDDMGDDALREVLQDLMRPLHDDHVWMWSGGEEFFSAYKADREPGEVDFDLIRSTMLTDPVVADDALTWGTLGDGVGYLRIHHFGAPDHRASMAAAMTDLATTRGLIIDARDNPGGHDSVAAGIAGCFADQTTPFMRIRLRDGPERDDFTDPIDWAIEPDADCRYDRPVVLLTNTFTVSAGDVFAMGMSQLPRVTHMGEHTTGAFSDTIPRELANGWVYSFSVGDWRDQNDVSHEGVGIVPSIYVINNVKALSEGRDLAIERALQELAP